MEEKPALWPTNSVLTTIRVLERKGCLRHIKDGRGACVRSGEVPQQNGDAVRRYGGWLASFWEFAHEPGLVNILEDQGMERAGTGSAAGDAGSKHDGSGRTEMIAAYHNLTGGIALRPLEGSAQGAIERVIHSLPEGVLDCAFTLGGDCAFCRLRIRLDAVCRCSLVCGAGSRWCG